MIDKEKYKEATEIVVEYEKQEKIIREQKNIEITEYFMCDCGNEILCVRNNVEFFDEGRRFSQDFDFAIFTNTYYNPNILKRIKYACWHLWTGKKFKDNIILCPDEVKKLILFLQKSLK